MSVDADFSIGIGAELQAVVVEGVPKRIIRMNPRGQLANGRLPGLGKKFAVSGLDQEKRGIARSFIYIARFRCLRNISEGSRERASGALGPAKYSGSFGTL